MAESVSHFCGMVCCGLQFSVARQKDAKKRALQIQVTLAQMTRASVIEQSDDAFEALSFENLFTLVDEGESESEDAPSDDEIH